jgi:ferrous iron transport protein A
MSNNFTTIMMNLSQVKVGTKVKIKSFENDDIILKLMEMGCLPEEEIIVWKKAPFGDPIYIMVSGYSLSLRLDEAEKINVELL